MTGLSFRRKWRWLFIGLLLAWGGLAGYHSFKPLPAGIRYASPERPVSQARFLADQTWVDEQGVRHTDQQIFDRVLTLISQAERLVVLDMFLFNDFAGGPVGAGADPNMRPLSDELAAVLTARKAQVPGLRVVLITDPINHLYGGLRSARLEHLAESGIEVVMTDLDRLRDSNPAWSGFWRLCCQWLGNSANGGWLNNPVGPNKVSLRTWLKILNFKANHRKTLVVDSSQGLVGLVTSGNPHDASSAHGNVALEFMGPAVTDLLATEQAVLDFSAPDAKPLPVSQVFADTSATSTTLQLLTESTIRDQVIESLQQARPGDRIDLAMFYLSHRGIIDALIDARRRGASLRVLLDPNEDAFGKKKNGIPNRQVASELNEADIPLRWCDTHGEQCHSKMLLIHRADGTAELLVGSANFTRRNLDDLNLETNVLLAGDAEVAAFVSAATYFERYWSNPSGQYFSQPYAHYADEGWLRYWRYRLMEASGMSTF
jgi:phosphatidylserine/phosphatidylglycerophosphate/cardiolipin synthase-like enzyme